jgi:hypothetical protein
MIPVKKKIAQILEEVTVLDYSSWKTVNLSCRPLLPGLPSEYSFLNRINRRFEKILFEFTNSRRSDCRSSLNMTPVADKSVLQTSLSFIILTLDISRMGFRLLSRDV